MKVNRRYKKNKKQSKLKEILYTHLENNLKEYFIVAIIFIIGIVIGVIFINNVSEEQSLEITEYISSFIQELKDNDDINDLLLLKDSINKNLVLAAILWFMGSTVIGTSVVYLVVCFRGFCLGYTISSIILTCGMRKRNYFFIVIYLITKYNIYTMYNSTCGQWNKTA